MRSGLGLKGASSWDQLRIVYQAFAAIQFMLVAQAQGMTLLEAQLVELLADHPAYANCDAARIWKTLYRKIAAVLVHVLHGR